jgi:Outer membrane protein beta-barrel domain
MRKFALGSLLLAAAAICAHAQHWEFGGVGGQAFLNNVPVSGAGASATAGFQQGGVFGAFLGQNISAHIAGEVRYEYMQSDLELKSGGSTASFKGSAHVVHYDLLLHTNIHHSPLQLFAAVGGGMKYFRGTGTEAAYQPLSQFGYFTKTTAIKPMGVVGGGVSFRIAKHVFMRTEVRDFITAFPTQVLTPPPGVKYAKLLHDVVPMAGLSYLF